MKQRGELRADKRITLRNDLYPRVNVLIIATGMSATCFFSIPPVSLFHHLLPPFSFYFSLSFHVGHKLSALKSRDFNEAFAISV